MEGNCMATKKAASAKKSKPTAAKKQTTTKVTTVTAASAAPKKPSERLSSKVASVQNKSLISTALIAEFIGTFILAAVALSIQGNAFFMGFALVAIILSFGALSGAHVNPLITIGAWVTRKVSGKRALGYVAAQVLGGMLALVVMTSYANIGGAPDAEAAMMGGQQTLFAVTPISGETDGVWHLFFAELIGAAIFAFAFAAALRMKNEDQLPKALTVGLGLFVALVIAGGAAVFAQAYTVLNPALAVSLQAIEWPVKDIFSILVYIVSPILGGSLGFFLYDLLRGKQVVLEEKL